MTENQISKIVFDCALRVHKNLGPGLLENSYQECLFYELNKAGLQVEKEKALPLLYYDVNMEVGYRVDLFVEGKVVVEVKSVSTMHEIHLGQLLTYLKLSKCKLGMLINFNVSMIKNGVRRVVNNL